MLQDEKCFLLAQGRQLDQSSQVFCKNFIFLGGAQYSPLYLVMVEKRDMFLRGAFLPPLEDLLNSNARWMITGLLCLIEIQKLSSYPILEYGLDSDPYESLPILLVEIIPGVLVTHIIYGEVVWVVDG